MCLPSSPNPNSLPAGGSDTTAALSAEWDCGRQVTNLNGARILGVVQQPDGAAVFPFKIPDAATHESAQHLFQKKKKKRCSLRLQDQNNKTQRRRPSECHIERAARTSTRPEATEGAAAARTIVVPLSCPAKRARSKEKDACIQTQRQLSPGGSVCACVRVCGVSVTEQGIISHHSTPPLVQVGGIQRKLTSKRTNRTVVFSWRFFFFSFFLSPGLFA